MENYRASQAVNDAFDARLAAKARADQVAACAREKASNGGSANFLITNCD